MQPQGRPGARTAAKPVLVLVTASGGALRAGVWTAAVLDAVEQQIPEFPRHVRFITGASGGMVGAALFVTSRVQDAAAGANTRPDLAGKRLADRISSDYLSPLARQFILRDIPLFLFPWRQSYDRGHALEDAFVKAGGLSELAYTFSRLADLEQRGLIPSIIFSPMLVEDGRRLLISNLELADLTTIDGENLLSESRVEIVDRIAKTSGTRLTRRDSLEFREYQRGPRGRVLSPLPARPRVVPGGHGGPDECHLSCRDADRDHCPRTRRARLWTRATTTITASISRPP